MAIMNEPHEPRDLPRLPRLNQPARYRGLYVIDFGDGVSVGYTADEVATLYQSGRFEPMRAYRIHRALPDGTLELVGVAREVFARRADDGFVFLRRDERLARADFETLKRLLSGGAFPCPARLQLALIDRQGWSFATVLIFSPISSQDVAEWLIRVDYQGGDEVEAGSHKIAGYQHRRPQVLDEVTFQPAPTETPRTLEQLLAARDLPVQR